MRPTGIESIRGAQAALAEAIVPELTTAFSQDVAQTLQMLLESLAGEWDTVAEDLRLDNRHLRGLLRDAAEAMRSAPSTAAEFAALVEDIDAAAAHPETASVAISALAAENNAWRALLERAAVLLEDATGDASLESLKPVRQAVYSHLRDVAARGWSFWDVASFRERMARERVGQAR
jgi:hypothetical protein